MNVKVFYKGIDFWGNPKPHIVTVDGKRAKRVRFGKRSPTGNHGGYSKIVFFTDTYVIKFGQMGEAYLEIQEEDRKYFAEVVYVSLDKLWYVQKKVDCEQNAEVTLDQLDFVENLGRKYGFGDLGTFSSAHYVSGTNYQIGLNWTVDRSGTPVIFDYAG